jgi:hypothetical protein
MRRYGRSPSTRDAKYMDLLMEGIELALKKRGYPALADMKAKWERKSLGRPNKFAELSRCPLYPRKRTSLRVIGMSAMCQKRAYALAANNRRSRTEADGFLPSVRAS